MGESFVTTTESIRLWTGAKGDGPLTILLSNGGAGCPDYLAPLAATLAGEGRRIVRWEQRGVGRSGGDPDGPFTIAQCVADMEAIREHFGCRSWVVAGHSWGADLSLIYALAHPERCAGLLCVAGGRLNNDREWHAAYSRGRDEGREPPLSDCRPFNVTSNAQLNTDYKRYIQRPTLFREVAALDVPIECIETGTPPVITPEHAYHVLEIMLKSAESGATGQALAIESTFDPPRFDDASTLGAGLHLVHDPGVTV